MMLLSDTIRKRRWYQRNIHQNLDEETNLDEEATNSAATSDVVHSKHVDDSDTLMMPRIFLLQHPSQMMEKNSNANTDIDNTFSDIITQTQQHAIPEWLELPPNGITEISGEAGTGKTQFGLGLCVACASRSFSSQRDTIRLINTSIGLVPTKNNALEMQYNDHDRAQTRILNLQQHEKNYNNTSTKRKNSNHNVRNPYNRPSIQPKILQQHRPIMTPLPSPAHQSKSHSSYQKKSHYYKSMYISMGGEGTSPSQIAHRLQQMAQCHPSSRTSSRTTTKTPSASNTKAILQRIWTRYVPNTDTFHELLFSELPQLLLESNTLGTLRCKERFGLLVFDSIAGLYRTKEDGGNDNKGENIGSSVEGEDKVPHSMYYAQRSQDLFTIAAQLKYISDRFGVGIVVLNQVTATNSMPMAGRRIGSGGLVLVPALGLTWSNCVNHRYILSRVEEQLNRGSEGEQGDNGGSSVTKFVRKIRVYCSPRFSTTTEAKFQISGCGVVLIQKK